MRQVIIWLPIHTQWTPDGIPIFGFGLMLFVAFVACTWEASRRARRAGIDPRHLQDLAFWIFLGGLIGGRLVFLIQYHQLSLWQFFRIWEGGLVFYGSAIGGVLGYLLAHPLIVARHHLSTLKLADVIAPTVAVGLCIGRLGCFLNGCCYGDVACVDCPAVTFPLSSPPRFRLVELGYQTPAGFLVAPTAAGDARVEAVERDSPADQSGLRKGDVIVTANDKPIGTAADWWTFLQDPHNWRGRSDLALTVQRGEDEVNLRFEPRTLGLHPTQLYETVSMALLYFLLLAYEPFKRRDGELFVVLMLAYSVHRFVNEMLRNDTDPVAFGLTLSQNGSVLFFAIGLVLLLVLRARPAQPLPKPA